MGATGGGRNSLETISRYCQTVRGDLSLTKFHLFSRAVIPLIERSSNHGGSQVRRLAGNREFPLFYLLLKNNAILGAAGFHFFFLELGVVRIHWWQLVSFVQGSIINMSLTFLFLRIFSRTWYEPDIYLLHYFRLTIRLMCTRRLTFLRLNSYPFTRR